MFCFSNRTNSDFGEEQGVLLDHLPDNCNRNSESQPLLSSPSLNPMELSDNHLQPWNTNLINDPDYAEVVKQAERAIEGGVLPVRIAAGSSGSYFVRNLEGVCWNFYQMIRDIYIFFKFKIENYWSI